MSTRKKSVIGALILSLAVVVGIGATMAYGPKGSWASGFHPGFHGMGCHTGPHGQDVADFIIWKMDRHVKELNLNGTQIQEYEKTKEKIKASIADAMKGRRDFHEIVREEMDKENPDMNALASLIKERSQHLPDMVSKHIDLFLSFYNMLDDAQRAKVIELFRWRMGASQG